jgi:hypothetical protein
VLKNEGTMKSGLFHRGEAAMPICVPELYRPKEPPNVTKHDETRAFVPPFSRATSVVLKSALSSQGKESWDYGPALTT